MVNETEKGSRDVEKFRAFLRKLVEDGQWFMTAIELSDLDGEELRKEAVKLVGEDPHDYPES